MAIQRRLAHLTAVAAIVFAAGCGGSPSSGKITGTVIYDGKPLAGGVISFVPANGNAMAAIIQPDGTYMVVGVPLGEAVVVVTDGASLASQDKALKEGKGRLAQPPKSRVTEKYGDVNKTELRFTVQAGPNSYDPPLK